MSAKELIYRDFEFPDSFTVTRYSSLWTPFLTKVRVGMPRIPTNSINVAFFMYPDRASAMTGSNSGGTGFYVSVEYPSVRKYIYGVTNGHVASGNTCIRLNTEIGQPDCIELQDIDWEYHPKYDIAVTQLPLPLKHDFHEVVSVDTRTFITDEKIKEWDIGIGDDLFMMGRFIDGADDLKNIPVARFGNISADPIPTFHPFRKTLANSYLVDMHSRSGFSGSPVFVYRTPGGNLAETVITGKIDLGNNFFSLLGIHWGQFDELWESTHPNAPPNKGYSGMTLVDPATGILELLDMESIKKPREKLEEDALKAEIDGRISNMRLESAKTGLTGDQILANMSRMPPTQF